MRYLDVLIPVKDEQGNLPELIRRVNKVLNLANIEHNLIVIDDNSKDKTFRIASKLAKQYPIKVIKKKGKAGKAYSILEGIEHCRGENLAMIDGDLQYPPEAMAEMFEKLNEFGVVVAKRKVVEGKKLRRLSSRAFNFIFGKALFGFDVDVQSGLKLFKKEIIAQLKKEQVSGWTLDLPLLITAREMGYKIGEVEINFEKRNKGKSKINFAGAALELAAHSLKWKFSRKKVYILPPELGSAMMSAGVAFNRSRYITHTTLHPQKSALKTITSWQKLFIYLSISALLLGGFLNALLTLQAVVAVLSFIYFIDVLFNFFLIFKSLHNPPEISISEQQLSSIKDTELPIYSILCPLYKEASVLPHFLDAISKIEWPKEKLDVLLLLEEDDIETIEEAKRMDLPDYVRTIIVPDSKPKTKPKACNFGLSQAKGEYLVIYDAEDIPDLLQLKKAYVAFKQAPRNVVCLQAKLNYHNPHQNFLTRLFTAEYSLWFDVILTGLQTIETTIPLGGTSNHFRTKDLLELEGWDPFNVTEDCDLGIRLFQKGYKTAVIDSTTLEEANSKLGNWVRQRSRWIKGYMQTYLVHNRNPFRLFREQGLHGLVFQLIVGGKIAFLFINPLLWVTTIVYFSFRAIVGPSIEALYPPFVFYMAAISLVFGNFLFLYYYMIGCAKREQWSLIKFVYLVPFYWLMVSWAACIAFYQLIFKPHYWEKTVHGLHLKKEIEKIAREVIPAQIIASEQDIKATQLHPRIGSRLAGLFQNRKLYFGASMLVMATMIANLCNFIFNAYLGRQLTLEDFGELSLFTSFLYLSWIPISAFGGTITHKIAYLFGKYSKVEAKGYLKYLISRSVILAVFLTILWIALIPVSMKFFRSDSLFPFLVFTPVWLIGILSANSDGYLRGTLSFGKVALIIIAESSIRLLFAFLFVSFNLKELVFLAIPLSLFTSMSISMSLAFLGNKEAVLPARETGFNKPFFATSILNGVSNIAFLTLDVILVKHFLDPVSAGQYGFLSLVGKMTFFFGSLLGPFMIPLVSKNEGARENSKSIFTFLFSSAVFFSTISFIVLGIFGGRIVPVLFGPNSSQILDLLPVYVLAMGLFTIAQPIVSYFQAKENYSFAVVGFVVSVTQVLLMSVFHANLAEVVWIMLSVASLNLALMGTLFIFRNKLWIIERALRDFTELIFLPLRFKYDVRGELDGTKLRILIFNWRDIKHKWAGGAEVYIHELAKKWVEGGHKVTIFCGNDGLSGRYEVIDGIQIIRRGGFYMVYIWAFFYYTLKLRGKFDLVIDSENGIPFFTPFYVSRPKFLLIHHVHQEVFREHLFYPFALLARFLEAKMMPYFYKDQKVVTVSESSKEEILKIAGDYFQSIDIVNPGIHHDDFVTLPKTRQPCFLYLGRLQPYKNIDVAIKAFAHVLNKYPKAKFNIAGTGLSQANLRKLAKKLDIENNVNFLGRVSEKQKSKLLAESWAMIQPSMIEGWGITVVEANASGTPVIASNVNGLRDSIVDGKTGILVKAKSVGDFSDAMVKIISEHNLREKLSAEAHLWSQNFSWDKSAQEFFKSINRVVDSPDKPISSYKGVAVLENNSF